MGTVITGFVIICCAHFVSCFDDEKGDSEVAGGEVFRPHVRSRTVQWLSVRIS